MGRLKGLKVLIADDEEDICRLLSEYVASRGGAADIAADGKMALEYINSKRYDFVFLDCNMPELTGIELAGYLKDLKAAPKIVMMTGYGPMDKEFAKAAGVDFYLPKPILLKDVSRILKLNEKKGLAAVDLVISVVVIGILCVFCIPRFVSLISAAKAAETKSALGSIRSAITIQYMKSVANGTPAFPSSVTAVLFTNQIMPENVLNQHTAIASVTARPGPRATSSFAGWWYIPDSGQVGAYSDGIVETSDW